MDLKKIYEKESSVLSNQFHMSSELSHMGVQGDMREDYLKDFLQKHLPMRYGIGSGVIVGPESELQSRQLDIVLYDHMNCPVLYATEREQIFPVEFVYGVIEVKSCLSKQKLQEGFWNIVSAKQRMEKSSLDRTGNSRDIFGAIFAYDLSDNSLDSLKRNLNELEQNIEPYLWPDLIVVLGQGTIYHVDRQNLRSVYRGLERTEKCITMAMHHKEESLMEFFFTLHDVLSGMESGVVHLHRYTELSKALGKHYVRGHDGIMGTNHKQYRLTAEFINRIYEYGVQNGRMTYREALMKQFGLFPEGMDEEDLEQIVYLYNPEDLQPLPVERLGEIGERKDCYFIISERYAAPSFPVLIDGLQFIIPQAYVTSDVQEEVEYEV